MTTFEVLIAVPGAGKTTAIVEKVKEVTEHGGVCLVTSLVKKTLSEVTRRLKDSEKDFHIMLTIDGLATYIVSSILRTKPRVLNQRAFRRYLEENTDIPEDVIGRIVELDNMGISPGNASSMKVVGMPIMLSSSSIVSWRLALRALSRKFIFTRSSLFQAAMNCLHSPSGQDLLRRFTHLIVDEAQDVSEKDWNLLQKFFPYCKETMLVGDPQQSIFKWRGSDPTILQTLISDPETKVKFLKNSHRVSQSIAGFIAKLLGRDVGAYRESGEVIIKSVPSWIEVSKYLMENSGEGEAALLLNRWHLLEVERALVDMGVPYQGESILRSPEAVHLLQTGQLPEGTSTTLDILKSLRESLGAENVVSLVNSAISLPDEGIEMVLAHKSKSREWNKVYLCGVNVKRLATGSKENDNLAYVMLTRSLGDLHILNLENKL